MIFVILLLMAWNFFVSVLNAIFCGLGWLEAKAAGGVARFMMWMGAIMSACGFTWVYMFILAFILQAFKPKWITPNDIEAMLHLGYLVIIVPIIGSGLAITIDSWAYFWRKRTLGSGATTAYNTFAQVWNTYNAIRLIPESFHKVLDVFKGDKNRFWIIVVLVAVALLGGILTTASIINMVARREARKLYELYPARRSRAY